MAPRLIILGWDSATFDVIDPLIAEGRLPVLAGLIDAGVRAPLRSTWPPMTDCAWTCAFTGTNPGQHGIIGSWYRAPGAYECRYFSSRDVKAPALWDLTVDVRHLVWNVPMTFPARAIDGAMVAGYGAPPGAGICEPAALQDGLVERYDVDDLLDRAPHGSLERFLEELVRGLRVQAEAIVWAAKEIGADAVSAVWPQVDRAQHFFWRFRGTSHPLAGAVERVYEAMDEATGAVTSAFPDADVMVVSDHGAGPLHGDVNVGAWLIQHGHASFGGTSRKKAIELAWLLPPPVRRLGRRLAPDLARKAMGAKLTGALAPFEWDSTKAFVGFHGDLWLNLKGREPNGTIAPAAVQEVQEELRAGLLELEDQHTGTKVFAGVHARDEIYSGANVALAPDLMLDSWSNGYRVAPNRGPEQDLVHSPTPLAGVDVSWSSDHRPLGIWVAAGPRFAERTIDELALYDVCATALALLEQPVPAHMDGRVPTEVLDDGFLARHPITTTEARGVGNDHDMTYSDEEAAAVAEHLKDLGYIE